MANILINSAGTQGDVNPFIYLGMELAKRGHHVHFATLSAYQEKITAVGMSFHAISPDFSPNDTKLTEQVFHPKKGIEFLFKGLALPHVKTVYKELDTLCSKNNIELLISGSLAFACSLIHENRKIPWISIGLQPSIFLSIYDFPVMAQFPWQRHYPFSTPAVACLIKKVMRSLVDSWSGEWHALRRDLNLKNKKHIFFDGNFSPELQLAAYPECFGPVQKDWPSYRHHIGPLLMPKTHESCTRETTHFLKTCKRAPLIFTLGSGAVTIGESFFCTCIDYLRKHPREAILVCGQLKNKLSIIAHGIPHLLLSESEPYATLFPQAKIIIHQGGIGTTMESMRSGRPSIILPFGQDQFDNAHRAKRLGHAEWMPINKLNTKNLHTLITKVESSKTATLAAQKLKQTLDSEHSASLAISQIENFLASYK